MNRFNISLCAQAFLLHVDECLFVVGNFLGRRDANWYLFLQICTRRQRYRWTGTCRRTQTPICRGTLLHTIRTTTRTRCPTATLTRRHTTSARCPLRRTRRRRGSRHSLRSQCPHSKPCIRHKSTHNNRHHRIPRQSHLHHHRFPLKNWPFLSQKFNIIRWLFAVQ